MFVIDGILTSLFSKEKTEDEEEVLRIFLGMLGRKRVLLVCEIMGYEFVENSEELMEKIEETKYGYKKFLRDTYSNIQQMEKEDMVSMLN